MEPAVVPALLTDGELGAAELFRSGRLQQPLGNSWGRGSPNKR